MYGKTSEFIPNNLSKSTLYLSAFCSVAVKNKTFRPEISLMYFSSKRRLKEVNPVSVKLILLFIFLTNLSKKELFSSFIV